MSGGWLRRWMPFCGALCCALAAGCAQLQVPAIDPSGDRLFLPGGKTTLEACAPKPAFAAPPKPQPCPASALGAQAPVAYAPPPPGAAAPCGPAAPQGAAPFAYANGAQPLVGGRNQLKATPARLVAPVGTEVVIVAGFCGPDGHFRTKENLEWTLAQESVGHFVEVGGGANPTLQKFFHDSPDKRSSNYALSRSFTESRILTRGTANPQDDVRVGKGQAWISLTSPTEGTSHVTILAPEVEDWERRRQTSTIHWIDAQWQFPGPAATAAGQPVALTTNVSRATNGSPLVGWLVRYSLPEGTAASFVNGEREVEVPTDDAGRATVELGPGSGESQTAQVSVQIVRPSQASGDLPKTVVGQGWTTVTWSAPGLSLRVLGPEAVGVGQSASLRIEVSNLGDLPARDVVVSDALPPTLKFVSSNPPGQAFGDRFEWRIGDLPPRTARPIDVVVQATRAGDVRYCVKARSADGLATEACLDRLRVFAPSLQVELFGPSTAEVGSEVQYRIRVSNRSASPLRNVQLIDQFDPGFAHVQGQRSPINLPVGELAAGEVRDVAVTFVARQPGTLCHTVQAVAEGGHQATMKACLNARLPAGGAPAPAAGALRILLSGPRQAAVGQTIEHRFSVINTGAQPLANVRVLFEYEPTLEAAQASDGFQAARGQLAWNVGPLLRDERREYVVQCRALQPAPAASVRVTATADPNLVVNETWSTAVAAAGAAPGAAPGASPDAPPAPAPGEPPVTGALSVTVADTDDPIRVGQPTRYIVSIKNGRNVSDRNVVLSFRLPESADLANVRVTGPTRNPRVSGDGRTWQMEPVAEMRADEALVPYTIVVTPRAAGRMTLEVEVSSWRNTTPIRVTADTTVAAQ